MKIIRLCTLLDFGGLEQRLVNISLIKDENEWVFCALGTGGKAAEEISKNGKRVVLLDSPYKIPSFTAFQKLVSFLRQENPDVVHTSGAEANFHGVLAARIVGVKTIIAEEIGIPNHRIYHKLVFRLIFRIPVFILGNSTPVINYLLKENGVKEDVVKLIPNPVLVQQLPKVKSLPIYSPFILLTVSRLKAIKNLEGVFKAISRLKNEGLEVEFFVIGDGDHKARLEEEISNLGLDHAIHLMGYSEDPWYLTAPHLFILNSFSEGFSNALAEAMALGIPCLSTKVGSAEELITDDESGWLVMAGDEDGLYQKLKQIILLDKKTLSKRGQKGAEKVRFNFSLENHRIQLLELYQKK